MKSINIYRTELDKEEGLKQVFTGAMEKEVNDDNEYVENEVVNVYPEQEYQTVLGFGGAFTEAAGYCFSKLSKQDQERFSKLYFDKQEGIGYTFGRLHMNSCDFSFDNYSCCEKEDAALTGFNIDRDRKYILPLIKKCQEHTELELVMAPWSPPAWMKDNGEMNHGGRVLPKYKKTWAEHYVKFIRAYEAEGIPIAYTSVQNEPYAVQTWDSCLYTAEEERDFLKDYLGPVLSGAGLDNVKILIWDHNKERAFEHAKVIFADEQASKYVWGTAFHWYSGDHFEALDMLKRSWPEKNLIMTECCVDLTSPSPAASAERYAHEIIGDFKNGTSAFVDWNLVLDETGGPNHVGNFCDAPIRVNAADGKMTVNPSYYYIGQFSRFLPSGSVRIASTSYTGDLETIAFKRPDGSVAVMLLNRRDCELPAIIRAEGEWITVSAPAHSLSTIIIQ